MSIRIILADDHNIVREGLRFLIEKHPDLQIIAEAENGRETVKLARELKPDIIIMDISMPDLNGIEATRQINREVPKAKVIALSMYPNEQFVDKMLEAGALGYLVKNCSTDELIKCIRTVNSNGAFIQPRISKAFIKRHVQNFKSIRSKLTPREIEVIQLIAEGKTTKEISSILHVSIKTVSTHRINIMEKLDIKSVAELTKYAIQEGITTLEI